MAARAKKSKLRDARLQLGLSQAEVGVRLGVTGAAIGHYETGISKLSLDRATQSAKLLGLRAGDVAAAERGAAQETAARPRAMDVRREQFAQVRAWFRAETKSLFSTHSGLCLPRSAGW